MLFELADVTMTRGGAIVLDRFSARIPDGASAIVGPSGSGKSSLLRLLNRLSDPDSGLILYRGTPIVERDVLELRREVMLVPQLPALIPGTVAQNIAYARELAHRQVRDEGLALDLAGLDRSYAGREAGRLSVGEQQRVMLARALAVGPKVLLLDEPTSALDEEATETVEAALARLHRRAEVAIVLVTHDRAQADRLTDLTIEIEPAAVPLAPE